jgi:hypothetical protein
MEAMRYAPAPVFGLGILIPSPLSGPFKAATWVRIPSGALPSARFAKAKKHLDPDISQKPGSESLRLAFAPPLTSVRFAMGRAIYQDISQKYASV